MGERVGHRRQVIYHNTSLGSSDYESTGQCRRHGLYPWCRKTSPAMGQLDTHVTMIQPVLRSPRAATTEGPSPGVGAPQREKPPAEKPTHHQEGQPPHRNLRAAHTAVKTQHSPKLANKSSFLKSCTKSPVNSLIQGF